MSLSCLIIVILFTKSRFMLYLFVLIIHSYQSCMSIFFPLVYFDFGLLRMSVCVSIVFLVGYWLGRILVWLLHFGLPIGVFFLI